MAVVDDRYFNQHAIIAHDRGVTPILTTFDLMSALQLSSDERADYVSRLRSAGIAFVPMSGDELHAFLSVTTITDDHLVENAELKALRENVQLCRMSNGLQLPGESPWLDGLVRVLIQTIKAQWHEGVDKAAAAARSAWLLQLLDIRGWSHRYVNEQNRGISQLRFRAQLIALMTFDIEAPISIRDAYWKWLDDALVESVRELHSDLYVALVQDVSRLIRTIIDRQGSENADVD